MCRGFTVAHGELEVDRLVVTYTSVPLDHLCFHPYHHHHHHHHHSWNFRLTSHHQCHLRNSLPLQHHHLQPRHPSLRPPLASHSWFAARHAGRRPYCRHQCLLAQLLLTPQTPSSIARAFQLQLEYVCPR